jgi:hypothetical protein
MQDGDEKKATGARSTDPRRFGFPISILQSPMLVVLRRDGLTFFLSPLLLYLVI